MDDATRDWLLDHHKESYKFQAERSDKIRDRISFLVTPFTVLGSGILYALSNYRHGWTGIASVLFYIPVVLATVLFFSRLGWLCIVSAGASHTNRFPNLAVFKKM
jgi:hypothetical protein